MRGSPFNVFSTSTRWPACASCHGQGKPQPILSGQRASYIAERLRHWKGDGKEIDAEINADGTGYESDVKLSVR